MAPIKEKLIAFRDHLILLNHDRKIWLILSGGVFLAITSLIIGWNSLTALNSNLVWTGVLLTGIILAVGWWYWTMAFIRTLLTIQIDVVDVLKDITTDIKEIKTEVKDLFSQFKRIYKKNPGINIQKNLYDLKYLLNKNVPKWRPHRSDNYIYLASNHK